MSLSSKSQLWRMMCINSVRSSVVDAMWSRSENPTMAFSGVRISWVMLARKVAFRVPDCWARAVSRRNSSWERIRLVTSRQMPKCPVPCPFLSKVGVPLMAKYASSPVIGDFKKWRM